MTSNNKYYKFKYINNQIIQKEKINKTEYECIYELLKL